MKIEKPFQLITSPDPSNRAFMTVHDQEALAHVSSDGNDGWPIVGETLYKNWLFRDPGRVSESNDAILWGNYILFDASHGGGTSTFIWVKNKTEEEKRTPYREWTEQGNHYWHGILHKVEFFQDRNFPVSTNGPDGGIILAARLYDRITYTPPVSEGSIFRHRLYLSPTEFVVGPSPVPTPTAVSWNYHGSSGSFPECLHPNLNFPTIQSAFASYTTGGGAVSAAGISGGQFFPATNFEEWATYTLSKKQQRTEAGWVLHEIAVSPPEQPDLARR